MNKKVVKVSFRIIALFVCAMFVSFIPEYLHSFFGDWHCKGSGEMIISQNIGASHWSQCDYNVGGSNYHLPTWHWGYRHYLFLVMGILLSIVQIWDIICVIDND